MATRKRKQQDEAEVFAQEEDKERPGRIRLDRPLTGAEAQAQDQANAERLAEERAKRFAGRTPRT